MSSTWYFPVLAFLAAAGPAIAATAEHQPAAVVWHGVDEYARGKAANAMSTSATHSERCGGVMRPGIFLHPNDGGKATLDFPPVDLPADGPARVYFVGYAGLRDGAKWDDPEHPADGARFYVSVNGKEVAQVALRERRWEPLIAEVGQAGPGHTPAKVTLQLATDSGPAGNSNYDWAVFGEPLLVVVPDRATPAGQVIEGTAGVVVAEARGEARLLVEGLDAAGAPVPDAKVEQTVEKAGLAGVRFDFNAFDACVAWRWRAEGDVADARGGSWQPSLEVASVAPTHAVTLAGQPIQMRVSVRNTGMASLVPSHGAVVSCGASERPVGRIAPGADGVVSFDIGSRPEGTFALPYSLKAFGKTTRGEAGPFSVWPALPELMPESRDNAQTWVGSPFALLENGRVRWLVNMKAPGLGALVWVWNERRWEPVGSVSPLVEVVDATGKTVPLTSAPPKAAGSIGALLKGGGTALRADRRCSLGGGDATLAVEMRLSDAGEEMQIAVGLRADKALSLGALRGPAVHVGDRATGDRKGIALFPGLEYLEGEEPSSSTRDLAPPLNNRVTPHKLKVAVPLMAVETADGGPAVALIWDAAQKWDGEHCAPAATFASPNLVEHQENHLMRLAVPSVPEGIAENDQWARTPYALQPGKELVLRQFVAAGLPKPDATGVFSWFDRLVGFPEVEKWPRSLEDELALCRQGFLKSVWDEKAQKSKHCVGWAPANAPGFAMLLLMDARTFAKGDVREQLLQRVNVIAEQTLRDSGPGGLSSGANCHTVRGEFPYHWGYLPAALSSVRTDAYSRLASMSEEGGWSYTPAKGHEDLGKPGTTVSGTCASGAFTLARYAALTGDPEITEGMRKALRNLRRFRVPRGAQGWECPIMEPDVLAAAYALRALVWAYMATGEKEWLDDARYWARTGLAFQYAWDDGEHPGMRYASIPVFGSTFFTHSWIGLPVQWCGYVYGYGLRELMRFDDNPLWRKQADGITVSGLYQQFPMESKELAGILPDSWGGWFIRRNAPFINPENILLNVLAMQGFDPGLRSVPLPAAGGLIHVTAPADFKPTLSGGELRAGFRYPAGQTFYVTLAPVAGDDLVQIRSGAEALPRRASLGAGETGWAFDPQTGVLAVGLRADAGGQASLLAKGIRFLQPAPPSAREAWGFDGNVEEWQNGNSCTLANEDGKLVLTVSGADPYALSGAAGIPAGKYKRLRMRARMTAGSQIGLFWRTSRSPGWGPDKEVVASLPGDSQWHEVAFDLSKHALWSGKVLQLRLDPEPANIPSGTRLEVDWIRGEE